VLRCVVFLVALSLIAMSTQDSFTWDLPKGFPRPPFQWATP